ncbi:MAG: hypothetical protein K6T75_09115 [Acetobacteraceae bacterium]|nr:hypothetical protein [Acetobacteraceae bacterium]
MDRRFGRCRYLVVDLHSGEHQSVVNPGESAPGGAGVRAAQSLVAMGADALLLGDIGSHAPAALRAGEIRVYTGIQGTVVDSLGLYRDGKLRLVAEATAPGAGSRGRSPGRQAPGSTWTGEEGQQ